MRGFTNVRKTDFKSKLFWYTKSTLYIDKRFNSPREYGNSEHIYTKDHGIKMAPKILSDLKRRYSFTMIVGKCNIPISIIDSKSTQKLIRL